MSVIIQVLNAVPRCTLTVMEDGKAILGSDVRLGQTTKALAVDGKFALRHQETGATVQVSALNVNGPATVVHVDGFEGVFYKVQALHAYPWGFGKEATFTYVYAIAQDQPQPVYYPVIYPRLFLVSLASDTKSADLFTVTIPTAQSAAPALQLLGDRIVVNEYTQSIQQQENPYMVYGGSCGHAISSSFF